LKELPVPVDTHDPNLHENFRLLIEQSFGGELSREDETALRSHLESCAACHQYKITVSQIASALGGFAFESTLEQTAHVQRTVLAFAHSLETAHQERSQRALVSLAAFVLSFLGSSVVWQLSDFFATLLHVSSRQIELGMLVLWVAPSVLASFALPLISAFPFHRQSQVASQKGWTS
jgi:anti-sigma factor RsiW